MLSGLTTHESSSSSRNESHRPWAAAMCPRPLATDQAATWTATGGCRPPLYPPGAHLTPAQPPLLSLSRSNGPWMSSCPLSLHHCHPHSHKPKRPRSLAPTWIAKGPARKLELQPCRPGLPLWRSTLGHRSLPRVKAAP